MKVEKIDESMTLESTKKSYSEPKFEVIGDVSEFTKGTQQDGVDTGTGGNIGLPISQN